MLLVCELLFLSDYLKGKTFYLIQVHLLRRSFFLIIIGMTYRV